MKSGTLLIEMNHDYSTRGPTVTRAETPGVKLMASGDRVDFTGVPPKVLEAPIVCPVCNKKEHVVDYLPAETIQRKQSLTAELTQVRTARDEATRGR